MIQADFEAELEARLGGNLVDVELTAEDYAIAFRLAKRNYKSKAGNNYNKQYVALDVVSGTTTYNIDPEIDLVIKLVKSGSTLFGSDDPFKIAQIQDVMRGFTGDLLTYELSKQFLENVERYGVEDVDFTHNKIDKTITLLQDPKISERWYMEAYVNLTDDQYREIDWVNDWALAECKIMLGRAYSKFQSLPSPTGEASLDGQTLIAEGREDMESLLAEIADFVSGDIAGGFITIG